MELKSFRIILRHVAAPGLAGIIVALLLWQTGLLAGIEGKTLDLRAKLLARPSSWSNSIVLAVVDQKSIDWVAQNMGINWPWPRELFGAVVTNCVRRGAEAIGYDVLFTENSGSGVEDDLRLRQAILQAKSFALGSVVPADNSGQYRSWPTSMPKPRYLRNIQGDILNLAPIYSRATFPIPELVDQGVILANVQHNPDEDGIYRRLHPFVIFDNVPLPALGLGVYLSSHPKARVIVQSNAITIDGRNIPLDDDGRAILNYRGPAGTYATISAGAMIQKEFQLLNNEISPGDINRDLAGKYVFMGYTAPGLGDLRPTTTDGSMSGVEINATMLDNFLTGDFILPMRQLQTTAAVVFLTFLSLFLLAAMPTQKTHVVATSLLVFFPAGAAFLWYKFGCDFKLVPVATAVAISTGLSVFQRYVEVGRQEKFIKHSFKHYLSPSVIDQILHNPEMLKLGGERKELTFFFSDLKNFTKISEGLEPQELTGLLNGYLTAMTDIILEEGGTVDKFVGDAIVAFWNAPLDIPDHAEKAVKTALRCQEKLVAMQSYFSETYGKKLAMRIGINTGYAVVGNMGSSARFDYTVLGDAVNLASRLEGANKYFGTRIMIAAATYTRLGKKYYCRELGKLRVVGRREPVTVFEALSCGHEPEMDYSSFRRGLQHFYNGDFHDALREFEHISSSDPASEKYTIMCRNLINNFPDKWSGVCELESK